MQENVFTKVHGIRYGFEVERDSLKTKKQKYFSLLDCQLAENLIFVSDFKERTKRG